MFDSVSFRRFFNGPWNPIWVRIWPMFCIHCMFSYKLKHKMKMKYWERRREKICRKLISTLIWISGGSVLFTNIDRFVQCSTFNRKYYLEMKMDKWLACWSVTLRSKTLFKFKCFFVPPLPPIRLWNRNDMAYYERWRWHESYDSLNNFRPTWKSKTRPKPIAD